ncbi:MAG: 50S ribosomal protein L7Ae [Candidatus Anstonellales archaeon]
MTNVKHKVPEDLLPKLMEMLSVAKRAGRVKKGVNEVTKSVERKSAKLVIIAEDVSPPEIVMHLPSMCEERNIPCVYVPEKLQLGQAAGLKVGSSSVSVDDPGEAKELFTDIMKRFSQPEKKEEKKEAQPAEEKKEEKKEKKPRTPRKKKEEESKEAKE